MRRILGLALALLAVTLLLNAGDEIAARLRGPGTGSGGALYVLAAARGHLLAPASHGLGQGTLSHTMLVGDASLTPRGETRGLRVARLDPALRLVDHRTFDLAGDPEATDALLAHGAALDPGGVLVVASSGRIRPRAPSGAAPGAEASAARRAGALGRWAEELGSEVEPFADANVSWALIALRDPGGWTKLAEAFSRETGVLLSFLLDSDTSVYRGYDGETLRASLSGPTRILLAEDLKLADESRGAPVYDVVHTVGGRPLRSIHVSPPSRILWRGLRLGGGPRLEGFVGLADGRPAPPGGARFSVVVNGEQVASELVDPGTAPRSWHPFRADLSALAGMSVDLELSVELETAGPGSWAAPLWGETTVVYGPER